jgi:hypothetical protein
VVVVVVVVLAVVGSKVVMRNCPTVREFLNDDEYLLDEEMSTIPYQAYCQLPWFIRLFQHALTQPSRRYLLK